MSPGSLPAVAPLDKLPRIGAPATRALQAAGYSRLGDLVEVPLTELLELHGVGPKAIRILEEALSQHQPAAD